MKTEEIVSELEKLAPLKIQESWDNSGIQIKSHNNNISAILLTLDVSKEAVEYAFKNNCNLIISHHPLFFSNFKKVTINSYLGHIISKCFEYKINILSFHTNIDMAENGLANYVGKMLNLKNMNPITVKNFKNYKIVTFIPTDFINRFLKFLEENNISVIENYKACSFFVKGTGCFYPFKNANPFIGEVGSLNQVNEIRIEFQCKEHELSNILKEIYKIHPYEVPVVDIYELSNQINNKWGFGVVGELENEIDFENFILDIKRLLNIEKLKIIEVDRNKKIKKVALCPGSGMSLINDVKKFVPDVYLTGDIKYHEAYEIKEQNLFHLIDIGHFESEKFFIDIVKNFLSKKINLQILSYEQKPIFKYI